MWVQVSDGMWHKASTQYYPDFERGGKRIVMTCGKIVSQWGGMSDDVPPSLENKRCEKCQQEIKK